MSNRKQLIPLRSRPMRAIPNAISKKQYPRCSYRCWFAAYLHTRENRAATAVEEQSIAAPHPSMCTEKKVIGLHVCPTAHFPRASVTERRMKASSSTCSATLLSRRIILSCGWQGVSKLQCIKYKVTLSNYFTPFYCNINWIFYSTIITNK